jgi:hypothetical protein
MKGRVRRIVPLIGVSLLTGLLLLSSPSVAHEDGISYSQTDEVIVIETGSARIAISKAFPAAMVISADGDESIGYGVVMSSALAYNATPDGLLVLEDVPYHASFEHATWSLSEISHESTEEKGDVVSVALTSSVSINKRVAYGGTDRLPGTPGIEIIEDWAEVTVTFCITAKNYSSRYEGVPVSPEYAVNGTTELKFDISIDLMETIDATDLALDMGLMMMESYTFSPTSMPEQYLFQGYQEDAVSESDPLENETDGDVRLLHEFLPRDDFKQLFTYVKDSREVGFFGWAREAEIGWSEEDDLGEVNAMYRTDGESLRVYLATPMENGTDAIVHDPSIGILPYSNGGYVGTPDDGLTVGISGESAIIGTVIGVAAVGAATTYFVTRRRNDDSQVDTIRLDKNRYYRRKP